MNSADAEFQSSAKTLRYGDQYSTMFQSRTERGVETQNRDQWGVQYGYVWAYPWVAGGGPNAARSNLVFSQLRFNLP